MFLDPVKFLVIAVVALVVLGPDQLPKLARNAGSLWRDFSRWRSTIDEQVRSAFPDLPATHDIAAAVRSPVAFLDRLARESETERPLAGEGSAAVPVAGDRAEGPAAATAMAATPVAATTVIDPWDSWPGAVITTGASVGAGGRDREPSSGFEPGHAATMN